LFTITVCLLIVHLSHIMLFSLCSTPFVEYESASAAGSNKLSAIASGAARRVSVLGVYKRIAEYTGDLLFPLSASEALNRAASSVDVDLQEPHSVLNGSQNSSSASSGFMSPTKTAPSHLHLPATPQTTTTTTTHTTGTSTNTPNKYQSVLGSPLKSGAQRVAVTVAPSPCALKGRCATPSRTVRTSSTSIQPTGTAATGPTPAFSKAVVSDGAKKVILSLLRPVASQRVTACELLESEWLNGID